MAWTEITRQHYDRRHLRYASDCADEEWALIEVLRKVDLPLERIGLEACSLTAWLHDGLRAEGLAAICIETRQPNAAMKTMPNKTDRNDARAWLISCAPAGIGRCM